MRIFSQKSDDWTFLISLNNELRGSRICGELLTLGLCLKTKGNELDREDDMRDKSQIKGIQGEQSDGRYDVLRA